MSAIKHQPATPLPWHQGPIDSGDNANSECVFDKDGEIVADCGARSCVADWPECEKNAAYVDHAAKAYPKLVEALQALAESHAQLEKERGSQRATHTANSRALLRELGEDA